MRELISGNTRAKLAAMWEGPFDHFVWLDSDAILWGNIIPHLDMDVDFQIFTKKISEKSSNPIVDEDSPEVRAFTHYMFNPFLLKKYDSIFEWRDNDYFCAGVYAAKKNVISYFEWSEVEKWGTNSPGLFQFDDQGLMNYVIHSKIQLGKIKSSTSDLQHIISLDGRVNLKDDCISSYIRFPDFVKKPRVVHFSGKKPFLINLKFHCHPFTIARLSHHRKAHGFVVASMKILMEELNIFIIKLKNRIRRVNKKLLI
jgi:hypothetical protein